MAGITGGAGGEPVPVAVLLMGVALYLDIAGVPSLGFPWLVFWSRTTLPQNNHSIRRRGYGTGAGVGVPVA